MSAPKPTRRTFLALPLLAAAWPALAARPVIITILGDSITAGYGLPGKAALPNQLHEALTRMGIPNLVRAAGVSGDTTAGGLGRVDFSVQKDTDLAIVALGGNDLLQGLDPKDTRANLGGILKRLKARKIPVLLAGILAPSEVGNGYARDFNSIFVSLSKTHNVPLYPNLIEGVARKRELNQPDGIHPNARGVQVITAKLAPVVAKALATRR
jgi:acyl-CoA thioesterase-1